MHEMSAKRLITVVSKVDIPVSRTLSLEAPAISEKLGDVFYLYIEPSE